MDDHTHLTPYILLMRPRQTPEPQKSASIPKLGDFSKLQSTTLFSSTLQSSSSSSSTCATPVSQAQTTTTTKPAAPAIMLGDFLNTIKKASRRQKDASSDEQRDPRASIYHASRFAELFVDTCLDSSSTLDSDLGKSQLQQLEEDGDDLSLLTIASSVDDDLAVSSREKVKSPAVNKLAASLLEKVEPLSTSPLSGSPGQPVGGFFRFKDFPTSRSWTPPASEVYQKLFSWSPAKGSHKSTPIFGQCRSLAQKQQSLKMALIPLCGADGLAKVDHARVSANGIHVFVDLSNINISFQRAVKASHNIPDSARVSPLPTLNLELLTQLLVRSRTTKAMNVGCSVHPSRNEDPHFVQELRRLNYRVDLRERKPVEEMTHPYWVPVGSSSEDLPGHYKHRARAKRWVEDLVDETLQTRIGESVMEYFDTPGTIVLATGDAKPAKFSDGFFIYVSRALKMGWNVEIIAWKMSMSSAWRDPTWAEQWGSRLRIIELDEFLDELTT